MAVELGLLTRTKLFQSHIIAKRTTADGAWEMYDEGPTIDEQVQQWVDSSGNAIVAASAPGYAMGWLDEELMTRSIMIGVVIIYRPALESSHAQRTTAVARAAGNAVNAPDGAAGPAGKPAGPDPTGIKF